MSIKYRGGAKLARHRQPVAIVGGFGTPASVLRPLARALTAADFDVTLISHRLGLDCSERAYTRLADEVQDVCARHDQPVPLVGYSRGGQLARVLTVRRPAMVGALVTLGTPFSPGLAALHPFLRARIHAIATLGSHGVPWLVTRECLGTGCCTAFWRDLATPWPPGRPFVAVSALADRTVSAGAARDPAATQVFFPGGHLGLLARASCHAAVVRALSAPPTSPFLSPCRTRQTAEAWPSEALVQARRSL